MKINKQTRENNNWLLLIFVMLMMVSCKNSTQNKVEAIQIESMTNIRFASKKDGYKEVTEATRLKGTDTKVTSTYYQMEGPAWENENVAFRNYFDERNGMDIFGKRKREMVLDKVGIDENYHELQEWGMDILKVGNSLGAGAVALIIGDSLYRIGPNSNASVDIIGEGKDGASLKFKYLDWKVQGRSYNVYHTISILPGTHYYRSLVDIEGLQGDEYIAAGIVDHVEAFDQSRVENFKIMSTFGPQDVNKKHLGMALATSTYNKNISVGRASSFKGEVDHTNLLIVKPKDSDVEFLFFAGWELSDKDFAEKEKFAAMVKTEIEAIE